ncbi:MULTISPECIES: hypothetical protein [Yersinia]|uniref:hypothetical protein n=1 Tax=Yersinia TaxID=629 RepID=UPI0005DEF926|nr:MULTISPECIES: hypothetical protein [Yersinia]MBW5835878.1 hypothetical protein [Yersinia enterocolitica]CNL74007.1 Uncharacterised protein [Yersinia enterocolitica]
MNIDFSIVTPTALYVKQLAAKKEAPKKQVRIKRKDIAANEVDPTLCELGLYIARCRNNGEGVRVPAMCASEWGHVLRTLELKRELA